MQRHRPTEPPKPDYRSVYTSPYYAVEEHGSCHDGSFIRSYIPMNPYRDAAGRVKAVVYLHGFCLGAVEIYQSHVLHLVQQGYYVFFPSYQRGFCRYSDNLPTTMQDLIHALFQPFPISPQGWLGNAIKSVAAAFGRAKLDEVGVDTYLFGHSLGGLFALSWPAFAAEHVPAALLPQQVVVANPIPDSESLIPTPIRVVGQMTGAYADRVDIAHTGAALRVPVAILHGNGDILVPVKSWITPFNAIASAEKRFYCSQNDHHGSPALIADHIQAGIDTSFIPNVMALMSVGGIASENTLDWRYIWHALDQVIRYAARADQLAFAMETWSDGVPVKPIRSGTPQHL